MDLDVLLLSRLQFALTIMFHYLFPPLSIGLGTLLVLMEGTYLWTGNVAYHRMTKFWTGIFAANFAMGVATGIVMEFQFGTNWAAYSRYVGDVFGSALAAEGIFAFFLESGFLAVLVFGWDRVGRKMHFFATLMVALGSIFSAVWIVIANSWQQVPVGSTVETQILAGQEVRRAVVVDFWLLVFNAHGMIRLAHTLLGSFMLGGFVVMSVTAYYVARGRHLDFARKSFTLALVFTSVVAVLLLASAHLQARSVAALQPAKLAAFEGHFTTTEGGTGMAVFGWPDAAAGRMRGEVAIPGLLSFLVYDDFTTPVPGLDKFDRKDWPPVAVPYLTYRSMVGSGLLMVGLLAVGCYYRWRGTLFEKKWLLWAFVFAVVLPYVANQAGWVAAETGRQPYLVYPAVEKQPDGSFKMEGGLRTADGLSNRKVVTGEQVLTSMIMFGVVYLLLFAVYIYVLNAKIQHGPDEAAPAPPGPTPGKDLLDAASRRSDASGENLTTVAVPHGPPGRGPAHGT